MGIDIFSNLLDYKKYFGDQLILSSTFLGLLMATSIFLLQSGFSTFEYSRIMFLKYYVRLTKFLFLLLGYNITLSSVFLYTNLNQHVVYIIHLIFSLIFIKYFLDFYSHKGYIATFFTNKFNPFKSRLGKYFRYITNLGLIQVVIILILIAIVVFYPLLLGKFGEFTERQGFISTVIAFAFCVISLIRIIPEYFSLSEQEYKHKENNELSKQIETDLSQELLILKDLLIKNGRAELESKIKFKLLDGEIQSLLSDKKDEAFFVINLWAKTTDVNKIVRVIEKYSYDFFRELVDTNVDVNSFVLSYFVRIAGLDSSKTYFVRAKRVELENVFSRTSNSELFIKTIKNKVIDDLFRNV
jgi:hypothetical protein